MIVVAITYWPALQAGFIWVDKVVFHDVAWLRSDDWTKILFHNFYDWTNYFRPLVVALFVAEQRVFGGAPLPMHAVSLGLHLANTVLVGMLAARVLAVRSRGTNIPGAPALAMLLYGLHPALIEPVVWISCQFELVATFFMLLGLLCNVFVAGRLLRSAGVAACFLLAACAKESAAAFPLLVAVLDWFTFEAIAPSRLTELRLLWRRQWPVYGAVLATGLAYLALRALTTGSLLQTAVAGGALSLQQFQLACWLFLTYWRILLWPMVGQGPLHEVYVGQFAALSPQLLATDIGAVCALVFGAIQLYRRSAVGALFMACTAALLPVLHIVPVSFDSSLYHERYAMTAIAVGTALLPSVLASRGPWWGASRQRVIAIVGAVLLTTWLGAAALNIRVTLPLWSDESKLWLWAHQKDPDSLLAKNHLLAAYLERDDRAQARQVAALLLSDRRLCPVCMVNVANLALSDGQPATARLALDRVRLAMTRVEQPRLRELFALADGNLLEAEHRTEDAVGAYRSAIDLEPLDPRAHMSLALLLARQGYSGEAQLQARQALSLYAPDEREAHRMLFAKVLEQSSAPR